MSFNAAEYIDNANKREQGTRNGEPPKPAPVAEVKTEPAKPTEPVKPTEDHQAPSQSSRDRRQMRQLLREVGELRGKLQVYQEIGKKPEVAFDPDAKPERAKYASDAEFTAALVSWQGKQETGKQHEQEQFQTRVREMAEKADEDIKLIPDWEEVKAKAIADDDAPAFVLEDHPTFRGLLATSEYQALAMHYFAQNPEELEEILELTPTPPKQIEEFRALEGHLRREYRKLKAAKPEEKKAEPEKKVEPEKPPTPKLPRPSESVSARGGSAAVSDVSPTMADGRTLNPAWKEQRNMREGLRR